MKLRVILAFHDSKEPQGYCYTSNSSGLKTFKRREKWVARAARERVSCTDTRTSWLNLGLLLLSGDTAALTAYNSSEAERSC